MQPGTTERIPRAQTPAAAAKEFADRGRFAESIPHWRNAVSQLRTKKDTKGTAQALVGLAGAYLSLGQCEISGETYEKAAQYAQALRDPELSIIARSGLGAAYGCMGATERAESLLRQCVAEALDDQRIDLLPSILNNLGSVLARQGRMSEALQMFMESASRAQEVRNPLMRAKALMNAARAAVQAERYVDATKLSESAIAEIDLLPVSHDQAFLLLQAGQVMWQLVRKQTTDSRPMTERAVQCYERAFTMANQLGDIRAASYALGYLGEVEEAEGNWQRALELTQQAAFATQRANDAEGQYHWQWRIAQLYRAAGDRMAAIAAYRRTIDLASTSSRSSLLMGCETCVGESQGVAPVHYELADLLLRQAATLVDETTRNRALAEARESVEHLKSAELQDYFQDECLSLLLKNRASIENIDPSAATIYIIPLPDRVELLLSVSGDIKQYTVAANSTELVAVAKQFRVNLEKRTTHEYLKQSQQLYAWLIGPLEKAIESQRITTLVFVPTGPLQSVPMGALHDGKHFLIERFAIAVVPGLTLIEAHPTRYKRARALAVGLSDAVQGFTPLPFVPEELASLRQFFRADTRLNGKFSLATLKRDLEQSQYQLIHIASHAQFERDPAKTFLVTHDTRISLDQLGQLVRPTESRGRPIELLTLSACQTAAGDERATLGLAGVAVQAGARSVLATLWFVNDQSNSAVVTEFYRQLHDSENLGKATALQRAQVKLLNDTRYKHPCYWAPYVMIGNWL